jgi:hypothetical protein
VFVTAGISHARCESIHQQTMRLGQRLGGIDDDQIQTSCIAAILSSAIATCIENLNPDVVMMKFAEYRS